jgi:flagellar motor switch protein FliM
MSEAPVVAELLSREEIDALVEELSLARRQESETRRLPGFALPDGAEASGTGRALRRSLQRFAAAQTRSLASCFQRPLEVRLLAVDEIRAGELAEILLPHERLVVFGGSGGRGFVWIGRPLLFAWMRLAFGATRELRVDPLPDRPPTPIELRFLRRVANELLSHLAASLSPGGAFEVQAIEDAATLHDLRSARLLVASFDVDGLEEIGRLRIALPRDLSGAGATTPADAGDDSALERAVLDASVSVTVEIGGVEMPLLAVANLAVGAVIPIEAPSDGHAVVRMDGTPKFLAQRGQLGSRLAVQVQERIAVQED